MATPLIASTQAPVFQALDAVTLAFLAEELNQQLAGTRVSKIQHLTRTEFVIQFWGGALSAGQPDRFYIQLSPESPCCFLTRSQALNQWVLEPFERPTGFCMQLRKALQGAKLSYIKSHPDERVLDLRFDHFNELGQAVTYVLSLELMGKQTNMILVDITEPESARMLGVAHTVSAKMSRYREVAAGLPYIPPPRPQGKSRLIDTSEAQFCDLLRQHSAESPDEIAALLSRTYWGLGNRLLTRVSEITRGDFAALYQFLVSLQARGIQQNPLAEYFKPHTVLEGSMPLSYGLLRAQNQLQNQVDLSENCQTLPYETVSQMLRAYAEAYLTLATVSRFRQSLLDALTKALGRIETRLVELRPDDSGLLESQTETGQKILSWMNIPDALPGIEPARLAGETISVNDPYSDSTFSLTVPPSAVNASSWADVAAWFFQRAKKERARRTHALTQRHQLESIQQYLQENRLWVAQAETLEALIAIRDEWFTLDGLSDYLAFRGLKRTSALPSKASKKGQAKTGQSKAPQASGILRVLSSEGIPILVGRSGHGNAKLLSQEAAPYHWWAHVQNMPGSHVVVQIQKEAQKPEAQPSDFLEKTYPQTLLEALNLAVYFSEGRSGTHIPVVYAPVRYVRKIPDSYPGHVTYTHESSAYITLDMTVIASLL
ncbi:MAG: NFACT family protein [Cyanobacteria bacterium]|nr:NFACT family protein [Cyanobacteriota bacterium]